MMMFPQRSPRRQAKQVNVCYFVSGVLVGFLASSFLSMTISFDPPALKSGSVLSPYHSVERKLVVPVEHQTTTDEGWKLIHVYVGKNATVQHTADASTIPNDFFHSTQWFSQLRQDFLVSRLLYEKRGGYFVDLAANDAIRISNTFALETYYGWTGLAIEPNPIYWSGLAFRKCDIAAAVVGKISGEELRFKFPKRAAPKGGLVGDEFDNKQGGNSATDEDQMRFTVTIRDIFERFQTPAVIDYLSLDVEGAETFVMESFPFDQYRFNLLTVERADSTLCKLLERNGYIQLKQLKRWGETLWVHSEAERFIDKSALKIDTENYKYRERSYVQQ
jgi:Methyltransferase FkbM domain